MLDMRVIARKALIDFYSTHNDAEIALEDWYARTSKANWKDFSDLKRSFRSADSVGGKRVVFNIKGNRYRLVAIVLFKIKRVYIRFVGTHEEYDRIEDIKSL